MSDLELASVSLYRSLSFRQKLYILILQCIGAALLSGAINLAISVGIYLRAEHVTVWILAKNTIAGDMGVTTLVQGVLTFLIVTTMVRADLRKGAFGMKALEFTWPDRNLDSELIGIRAKVERYFTGDFGVDFRLARDQFWRQIVKTLITGFVMSIICFCLLWPLAILVIAPYWSNKDLAGTWTPMIMMFIYTAILAFFQTPICALIALGSPRLVAARNSADEEDRLRSLENGLSPTTEAEKVAPRSEVVTQGGEEEV